MVQHIDGTSGAERGSSADPTLERGLATAIRKQDHPGCMTTYCPLLL